MTIATSFVNGLNATDPESELRDEMIDSYQSSIIFFEEDADSKASLTVFRDKSVIAAYTQNGDALGFGADDLFELYDVLVERAPSFIPTFLALVQQGTDNVLKNAADSSP